MKKKRLIYYGINVHHFWDKPYWCNRKKVIRKITEEWLDNNTIPYDKLIVESGNVDIDITLMEMLYSNRIISSKREQIKVFVEDDLNKAMRLADICEIVFLINQPYNQESKLAKNIIRVKSWVDIYHYIRDNF
jgi:uncharacterized HAD superfamily protein